MNRRTPQTRVWSQCLIAYEAGAKESLESDAPAAFVACEKLVPHLAALMGKTGMHALLSRAHALARMEMASLEAVSISADGMLERSSEVEARFDSRALAEGRVVLLARLLDLLLTFIGEGLTVRIIGEVWPELSPSGQELNKRGKDEKTK